MINEHLRSVFNLPYFYMLNASYDLTMYVQYCRAESFVGDYVVKDSDKAMRINLRDQFIEIKKNHNKDIKSNKFLKEYHKEHIQEYAYTEAISRITPKILINTGLAIALSIEPQNEDEQNRLIGLLMDLRLDKLSAEDFSMTGIGYLCPTTVTLLYYLGDINYTMEVLRRMFPAWFEMQDEDMVYEWIRELNPIRFKSK